MVASAWRTHAHRICGGGGEGRGRELGAEHRESWDRDRGSVGASDAELSMDPLWVVECAVMHCASVTSALSLGGHVWGGVLSADNTLEGRVVRASRVSALDAKSEVGKSSVGAALYVCLTRVKE